MSRAPDFNRLARLYRWMEWLSFGPWLALTRFTFLNRLTGCQRALVLGDGDGRFTARLLGVNEAVVVDAIDASAAMLRALECRAGREAGRVQTRLADVREWKAAEWQPETRQSDAAYDLIATHFFLDCLTTAEVAALAARLRDVVAPDALWVVSEFAVPDGWRGALIARPVVGSLYVAFGWLTGLTVRALPDHASALGGAGFHLVARRARLGGLLVSELWCAGDGGLPQRIAPARAIAFENASGGIFWE
jgi:SAM-dependent methyltransferase